MSNYSLLRYSKLYQISNLFLVANGSTVERRGVGGSYVMGEVKCETVLTRDCAQIIHKKMVQNSKIDTDYCIV